MSISRWLDRFHLWSLLLLAGLLAACAGSPPLSESVSATPPVLADAPAPVSASVSAPPSASASMAEERAFAGRDASKSVAPRLGTQWGEGVESRVRTVQARRVTPDQPDEVAAIGYNDAAGVRSSSGPNPQQRRNLLLAQGDVEWSVRDENDRPLPLLRARQGGDMFRIAGQKGARYTLVFQNLSERNYEVIATVDGLDVLTGQPGSMNSGGYVLSPRASLRIEGFRKSNEEVAAFRFSAPGRAYAANTEAGDVRNIGVIGAALFELEMPGVKRVPRRGASPQPNPFPADGAPSPYAPPPVYRK